jgi:hypothetical protein
VSGEWVTTVREWLPRIVRQHTTNDHNWLLSRHQRITYTLKALACLLLNREGEDGWRYEGIVVAMGEFHRWQHPEFGDAGDWDEFRVPFGWRIWQFAIGIEGYP